MKREFDLSCPLRYWLVNSQQICDSYTIADLDEAVASINKQITNNGFISRTGLRYFSPDTAWWY